MSSCPTPPRFWWDRSSQLLFFKGPTLSKISKFPWCEWEGSRLGCTDVPHSCIWNKNPFNGSPLTFLMDVFFFPFIPESSAKSTPTSYSLGTHKKFPGLRKNVKVSSVFGKKHTLLKHGCCFLLVRDRASPPSISSHSHPPYAGTNANNIYIPIGIVAHRTSEDNEGVYNHRNEAQSNLRSMKPFWEGEPGPQPFMERVHIPPWGSLENHLPRYL